MDFHFTCRRLKFWLDYSYFFFSMNEKGRWARTFMENGYSKKAVIDMDESSLRSLINFFKESGFQPDDEPHPDFVEHAVNDSDVINPQLISGNNPIQNNQIYPVSSQSQINNNSNDNKTVNNKYFAVPDRFRSLNASIRDDQDVEYLMALEEMMKLERLAERQLVEKEKKDRQAASEKRLKMENCRKEKIRIFEEAKLLPEEPKDGKGTQIMVILPGGKRVERAFEESQLGKDVYRWIAAFDELFENEFVPLKFDLVKHLGQPLSMDKTLIEQKLIKKVLLNVLVNEESTSEGE
ncbi:hypothetical protein TRFO_32998 [Tritrichomonas foetus]|uniref:UBX domain-containing protein n=1 Tax=Tritrichomonas foetus TaxID=1144522 RepID=A0A1J4JMK6_9EUKA|nr:hypothetical protein TRFO_32998 [Tritrichomonas foetus]|eukprot:OHT00353.1 hypothetical protein TRFO_32998 [Tritrichomonas foetus]